MPTETNTAADRLLIVELDDPKRPAGPATVVGHTRTIDGYRSFRADRDDCRSERLRLWRDTRGAGTSVGSRVDLTTNYHEGSRTFEISP